MKLTKGDFIDNDLLYAIAENNVDLAVEIAKQFGGQEVYIIKWDTIRGRIDRDIRNAYIVSQRQKLAGHKTLAKELNLCPKYVRSIYKSTLKKSE